MLKGDIKQYVACGTVTLNIGNEDCTKQVLLSWLVLVDPVRTTLETQPVEDQKELTGWFQPLQDHLCRWARGQAHPGRCECGETVDDVGSHFCHQHSIEVACRNRNTTGGDKQKDQRPPRRGKKS